MVNLKQHLVEEAINEITNKEQEIKSSDNELEILGARIKVENKILDMQDVQENLKEDFMYSVQALEHMILMETNRNHELKKGLEMLRYRRQVIESQFSESELDC